jgi:menaquinone-dependent protoporphyrinogen IX oxidase
VNAAGVVVVRCPMKAIVLYRSVSGFTKKYAQWIAEALRADLFDCREVKPTIFAAYDLVVFGGCLHAVGINGIEIIKRNLDALAGKRVIVFATGASEARDYIPAEVIAANFSERQRELLRFFYFRGGFDFNKLDLPNKVLMTLFKWKLSMKRSAVRNPDEGFMLMAYEKPVDFTYKENIQPLIDYANS